MNVYERYGRWYAMVMTLGNPNKISRDRVFWNAHEAEILTLAPEGFPMTDAEAHASFDRGYNERLALEDGDDRS